MLLAFLHGVGDFVSPRHEKTGAFSVGHGPMQERQSTLFLYRLCAVIGGGTRAEAATMQVESVEIIQARARAFHLEAVRRQPLQRLTSLARIFRNSQNWSQNPLTQDQECAMIRAKRGRGRASPEGKERDDRHGFWEGHRPHR